MTTAEALAQLRRVLPILVRRRNALVMALGTDYKRDELDELIDSAIVLEQTFPVEERDPFPAAGLVR